MNTTEIKKKVREFKRQYLLRDVTYPSLREVFEKQGFTVIEFNPVVNDPDVETVIRSLKLSDMIAHSKGFLYVDKNYRILFVNEKLSEDEKVLVLAHEEGHYFCGHMSQPGIVGKDVKDEHEANEFSHYLLEDTARDKTKRLTKKYRKWIVSVIAVVFVTVLVFIAVKEYHDQQLYEGEYYVTENGEKYHKADCITIQDSEVRRLTKEDVKSGKYQACEVCQPG